MQFFKLIALLVLELTIIAVIVTVGVVTWQPKPIGHGSIMVSGIDHSKHEAKEAPVSPTLTPEVIRGEITRQAEAYGVNVAEALAIAKCESTFNPKASSKKSTAKGIYQFTDPTWRWIGAKGHQFDYQENIKQFMTHYPKSPQWWSECLP